MFVVDAAGEVLFAGAGDAGLGGAASALVERLIARHAGDESVCALSDDGELVRIVPLDGERAAHYAVFVEAIAMRSPLDDASERYSLSERERDVLAELLRGASTAEIAARLIIAESTVATHVRNIGAKMNATKRKEILAAVFGSR